MAWFIIDIFELLKEWPKWLTNISKELLDTVQELFVIIKSVYHVVLVKNWEIAELKYFVQSVKKSTWFKKPIEVEKEVW